MSHDRISRKSLVQYGFIALPVAFAGFPLYVLAPDFYATQYGISLSLLGTLLLAIRLLDAIQDPLIGWWVDKLNGKFIHLVILSGIVLCMSIFALFNSMFWQPALWFALCMIIAVSAYSILTIILGTQATLWTNDRQEQIRIAGARESFGLIGLVTAVSIPAILINMTSPAQVYIWYSAILAFLMLFGAIGFAKLIPHIAKQNHIKQEHDTSLLAGFRALPSDSIRFFTIYGMSMLASSIPAVLVIFYIRDLLGVEHSTGVFLLLYFLSGAAGMPLWKAMSARIGKYKTWAFSNILAVLAFIGAFFLGAGDIWAYGLICLLSGMALGADLSLPPSILSDHIHMHDNRRFSGTHYALLAFTGKASLAIASAVALPILDAAGFKPQTINSDSALMALSVTYALLPCILKLFAVGLLYLFFIRAQSGGNHENNENLSNNGGTHHA